MMMPFLGAGILVLISPLAIFAQTVVTTHDGLAIWYDVRPSSTTILSPASPFTNGTSMQAVAGKPAIIFSAFVEEGNAGGPGDGQTLFLSPRMPIGLFPGYGLHWTGSNCKGGPCIVNHSKKSLYRYVTVQSRGGIDEVLVSLGLHTQVEKQGVAGDGNRLESVNVVQTTSFWDSIFESVVPDDGQESDSFSIDTYANRLPTDDGSGPIYNPTGGLVPMAIPYRVAEIQFTAGVWKKFRRPSTYLLHDSVNDGLILRADAGGISGVPESPDFGYSTHLVFGTAGQVGAVYRTGSSLSGNLPEANSGGDGLTIGTTSLQPDATIVISSKGDFNGDGILTSADNSGYSAALQQSASGTLRVRELYLGDFDNNGAVSAADNAFFSAYIILTSSYDCSNPADCP